MGEAARGPAPERAMLVLGDDALAHRLAAEPPALLWDLHPGYVLRPGDRVVVAATRSGLPELLGGARAPAPGAVPPQGAGRPG
ncbi:hypothetical protein [Streptomyces hydrogenans]